MPTDARPTEGGQTGTDARLVRMANQIAAFFATQRGIDAEQQTADHIRSFWDPRMRSRLAALLAAGGDGLGPVALGAARKLSEAHPP